jgi:hypothetical protein
VDGLPIMFAAMRRMLVRLALAAAIVAIGGGEVLAHGKRSNFSTTFPNGFGRSAFVTPGFSSFPRATTVSRRGGDRVIIIVRERPVFFRPAFDQCRRRPFVTTPRLTAAPCSSCRRSFTGVPWAMHARSFARR